MDPIQTKGMTNIMCNLHGESLLGTTSSLFWALNALQLSTVVIVGESVLHSGVRKVALLASGMRYSSLSHARRFRHAKKDL
eukprot:1272342-Amphidinium_carterae.1